MLLIAIILSLIAERFLGSMSELRRFGWFARYSGLVKRAAARQAYLNGAVSLLLLLAPLLVITGLIDHYLSNLWFMFGLGFAVLILLFSFGPTDLEAEVEAFVEARERGDEESAIWHAAELLGSDIPTHSAQLTRRILENILVEVNERLLGVLFWFVLLGPAGALLYRLTQQLVRQDEESSDDFAEAARRLHQILAWIPARICALAYALAGSFVDAFSGWRSVNVPWTESSRKVLIASGLGALRYEDGEIEEGNDAQNISMVYETLSLARRAVLVFISMLALFTLAGWMA